MSGNHPKKKRPVSPEMDRRTSIQTHQQQGTPREREHETIDKRKLIVYSEIMKPKFDEI